MSPSKNFEPRSAYLSPPKKFDFNPEPKSAYLQSSKDSYFNTKYQDIIRKRMVNEEPSVSDFNLGKSNNFSGDNFYSNKGRFNNTFSQTSNDLLGGRPASVYDTKAKFMENSYKKKPEIFGHTKNNQYMDDFRSRFRRIK